MTTDPNEIRSNIESTRSDLSGDVDALTDRVNPRRAAGRQADRARGTFAAIRDRIMGTAGHASEVSQAKASSAGHQASAKGAAMRDEAAGSVRGAAGSVREAAGSVREAAGSVRQALPERTQGSPLAAGLIAFGLGALVSSLLPPSQQEKRMAGQAKGKATEHAGQLKQQAGTAAHEMQDHLRQPAQEAVGSVRSRASEGASTVRDQGRSTAGELRGQASEAGEHVRRR